MSATHDPDAVARPAVRGGWSAAPVRGGAALWIAYLLVQVVFPVVVIAVAWFTIDPDSELTEVPLEAKIVLAGGIAVLLAAVARFVVCLRRASGAGWAALLVAFSLAGVLTVAHTISLIG